MADCGNYLVATVHWWAYNMKKKKEKEKENKTKRKMNQTMITESLHLLYSTFEKIPVVSYHANLYWNGYTNMDNYSYPLDDLPCNLCIWRYEDMDPQHW